MAVEDLKNKGTGLELCFGIGKGNDTKKLESLLQTLEMQSLNLIIGGVSDANQNDFGLFKAHNIKYVVPFLTVMVRCNNGNIFQVNPLPKSLNDNVSEIFLQTYRNSNIIFVSGGQNDKMELLSNTNNLVSNIRYETISIASTLDTQYCRLQFREKNIIIQQVVILTLLSELLTS